MDAPLHSIGLVSYLGGWDLRVPSVWRSDCNRYEDLIQGGPGGRGVGLGDFDFGHSTNCLVVLGQMGVRMNWLCRWAIWRIIEIKVNPTQVYDHQAHPVPRVENGTRRYELRRRRREPKSHLSPPNYCRRRRRSRRRQHCRHRNSKIGGLSEADLSIRCRRRRLRLQRRLSIIQSRNVAKL